MSIVKGKKSIVPVVANELQSISSFATTTSALEQALLCDISSNLLFGANWAVFHKSGADYAAFRTQYLAEMQKKTLAGWYVFGVTDGFVLLVDNSLLFTLVNRLSSDLARISAKRYSDSKTLAFDQFGKFFTRALRESAFPCIVGLFSTNETARMVVGGKEYPAFRLSTSEVISYGQSVGLTITLSDYTASPTGTGVLTTMHVSR